MNANGWLLVSIPDAIGRDGKLYPTGALVNFAGAYSLVSVEGGQTEVRFVVPGSSIVESFRVAEEIGAFARRLRETPAFRGVGGE